MQGMPQAPPQNPLMAAMNMLSQQHPPAPPGMPPGMPPQGMPGMPGPPGMMPHPPGMPMPGQPPMGGMPMPGMPPQGMPGMPGMMPQQQPQGMPPDMRTSLLTNCLHMLQAWMQVSPMGPEVEHAAQIEQGLQMLLAGTSGPPQGSIHGIVTMPQPPPPADDGSMVEGGMHGMNGGIPGGQGYSHEPDMPPEGLEGEIMPPNH